MTGAPQATITVTEDNPNAGETVTFALSYSGDIPAAEHVRYDWTERNLKDLNEPVRGLNNNDPTATSVSVTNAAGEWRYQVHLSWPNSPGELGSNKIIVTWK